MALWCQYGVDRFDAIGSFPRGVGRPPPPSSICVRRAVALPREGPPPPIGQHDGEATRWNRDEGLRPNLPRVNQPDSASMHFASGPACSKFSGAVEQRESAATFAPGLRLFGRRGLNLAPRAPSKSRLEETER
jgi:hypothetical protein